MSSTLRLLYTEDNRADTDLTRRHFAVHAPDIALDVAATGEQCLAQIQRQPYDVLLLDNHLPDMDAVDVIAALAARDVNLPIIVVTAAGNEELVVRLLRLGAWDYVPKRDDYIATLPDIVRHAAAEFRHPRNHGRVARDHRRVLYIERHESDIDLTLRHLADHAPHLQVDVARSSREALDRLQSGTYDAVLTDLRMPDMSALDLLRELRRRGSDVPVILVTGLGDEAAAIATLKLGAYDYLVKRNEYLTQVPYSLDNSIDRCRLSRAKQQLEGELVDRERAEMERVQLAEQLQRAQKIDSLGRLAGGVAHDFNNLLTVITGNADLILQSMRREEPLWESASDIKTAAARAGELTRQLLAFSRRQVLVPRVMDLNASIRDNMRMLRRLLHENVELVTVVDEHLGHVRADPGQIDQVLVNLAVNARDAMPRGGRLTIETSNVSVSPSDAAKHPSFREGDYVLLAVSDNGVGIDKEILPYIFEPFFTTKEQGKGTGLGLSMVYGIVKQSGGWIWVYSEVGRGTTFKVYLPRIDEPLGPTTIPKDVERPCGHETILVVEDEPGVRKLTCHILRAHGYAVIEAASGGEAIAKSDNDGPSIHLLVTDVVMPGMSGPELAGTLTARYPNVKVLYTSGYTDATIVEHGLGTGVLSFLQKPFTPGDLTRKVRDVLDA